MFENSNETLPEVQNEGEISSDAPVTPEIVDLDSVEKFKYQGQEMTRQQLHESTLRYQDYTRKSQQLAEDRKYNENLYYDLDSVRNNPALAEKFRSVYPKSFHKHLDHILSQTSGKSETSAQKGFDPDFVDRFNRMEQRIQEREIEAINSELDSKFGRLSKQYPLADEEAVVARAQSLVEKGQELNDRTWDALWKSVHERNQKLMDKIYAEKVTQQKTLNQKNKDVPSGGGTPIQGRKEARTIKEASELALKDTSWT